MTELIFKSDIDVELIQSVGDDRMLANAALVSTKGKCAEVKEEKVKGLLNSLMSMRHGTPFEHGSMTVRVDAPIKVWREWHRHRVGWSYNETSGRFKELEPVFYIPPRERLMIRPFGFKSIRPEFDHATDEEYETIVMRLQTGYKRAYDQYVELLAIGTDRGLARDVLGVGIYSAGYCTANPRSIMHFLELRTNEPTAKRPSKPLWEIEQAARKLESLFAQQWPITYQIWIDNGRAAP